MSKELPPLTESRARELLDADRADLTKFFNTLAIEDDLGMVVRAHIQLESILQEFIRVSAPQPGQVKFSAMDFEQMLQLSLILGLRETLKPALSAIGRLRNKFAHQLDMTLDDMTADNLYGALDEHCKKATQTLYGKVFEKGLGPKEFKNAAPKGRVGLSLMSVRSALRVELAKATHELAT